MLAAGNGPLHMPFLVGAVSFFHNIPGVGTVRWEGVNIMGGGKGGRQKRGRVPGSMVPRGWVGSHVERGLLGFPTPLSPPIHFLQQISA